MLLVILYDLFSHGDGGHVKFQPCGHALSNCTSPLSTLGTYRTRCPCVHSSCNFYFLFEIQTCREGDNFEKTGQQREAHINFHCNPKKTFGEPAFTGQEGNKYFFDVQTPLVCSPPAVECAVSSSDGKSYDLTPLGLTDGKLKWLCLSLKEMASTWVVFIKLCMHASW